MKRTLSLLLCLIFSFSLKSAINPQCLEKVKASVGKLKIKGYRSYKKGNEVMKHVAVIVKRLEQCGFTAEDLESLKEFQKKVIKEVKDRMKTRETLSSGFYAQKFLKLITDVEKKYKNKESTAETPGNKTDEQNTSKKDKQTTEEPPPAKAAETQPKQKETIVITNETLKEMEGKKSKPVETETGNNPPPGEKKEEKPPPVLISRDPGFPSIDISFPTGEDLITPEGNTSNEEAFPVIAGNLKKQLEAMEKQLHHLSGTVNFLHLGFIVLMVVFVLAAAALAFTVVLFKRNHRQVKDLGYQISRLKRGGDYDYKSSTVTDTGSSAANLKNKKWR